MILGKRKERLPKLLEELNRQGITNYEFWPAIYLPSIKASINAAHKQIVRHAMLNGLEEVCIGEDDLQFSSEKSWQYFLDNKPVDFDIYLSMVYLGEPDEYNVVKEFTGLTLYIVSRKFYEKFLSVPDDDHLDRLLGGLGKYVVCKPFVAKQFNGISSNTGKWEDYDHLLRNREFL